MRGAMGSVVLCCGMLAFVLNPLAAQELPFIRGDGNQDGRIDLSDGIRVLLHLFSPGRTAPCEDAVDTNDDGTVDIADTIYVLAFMFAGGPPPPPPFGECGVDETADDLTCGSTWCAAQPPRVALADYCTPDPTLELGWKVTNLNAWPITLAWQLLGTAQSGTLDLAAREAAVVTTVRVPGVNTMALSYRGEEFVRRAQAGIAINEVVASCADSLADEDGDDSDWIELYMSSTACFSSVDLTGWYLTDDPGDLTKWRFPAVTLEPGGYLVVFASDKDRAVAGEELHTNFKLEAEGEYLALVAADGVTIVDEFSPTLPEQLTDVSYGWAQQSTTLVQARAEVKYHVPTAADATLGDGWTNPDYAAEGWQTGVTGLGFTNIPTEGFQVTRVQAQSGFFVRIRSLTDARNLLNDPARQQSVTTETAAVIDYFGTDQRGNFSYDNPFPGIGYTDVNNFAVRVTGTIQIPEPGEWSFGVNSDDGFSLELKQGDQTFTMEYPNTRGAADTIQVFNLPSAGQYQVTLIYFENTGGATLELFAAQGNHPTFSYDYFRLVGDTAQGGISLVGFGSQIAHDVGDGMEGVNASLWVRIPFQVAKAAELGNLILRMKYEDGFVAYVNGQEAARRNAPGTLAWNSAAASDRPTDSASVLEEISLAAALPYIVDGANVLAIHGLNDAVGDGNFLLAPELIGVAAETQRQYMPAPTPGTLNVPGAVDFVRPAAFSVPRGFYDTAFSLALDTPTEDAQIRYTLNGATPTATTGTIYTAPLTITRTTVIRAAAFRSGYLDSPVVTRSYFFVEDVIRQSPTGQAPGTGWPTGAVNGQLIDYGMDPDIVNSAAWTGQIRGAMVAVPTLSLVTDLANIFDASTGIYVNAQNDGRAWERRTSVELVYPDGTEGFGVDAGLRIRGAFSRSDDNPKHSFRLIFRSVYGAGKLEYALFGGEGVDEFDKVDLRTSQNYSWAFEGNSHNTMLRDVFSRDVQRDMGQPYTRSRYYHLYLNGQYWGLYQTQERADAKYAAAYLHGDEDAYDSIKNDSSGSRALQASDGTMDAYERLYDAAVAGFSSNAAYLAVQGLFPDGTPNPAGEKLLDPENLMDYMACTYYTGDPDAPVSCWGHFSNNVFALYNRVDPKGFKWLRHDAEHSLGANGGLNEARLLTDSTDRSIGQDWDDFNPAWLHLRLTENLEYRLQFADRVNKYFAEGGLLSSGPNIERLSARAQQIQQAIIAESARWGDAKVHPPMSKTNWQNEVNSLINSYFPQRTQIVLLQMRSVNMFPAQALVTFSQNGGTIEPGFTLTMSQGNGTTGTIYFTLDGTDPRLWGGGINPVAAVYQAGVSAVTLEETTTVKARVYGAGAWGAMTEARFLVGLGGLVINEIMASNHDTLEDPDEPDEYPDWIELYNGTAETIALDGMYLTDDLQDLTKWQIAGGVEIEPGGYLLFFADDDGTQGAFHTNYKLSASGESIALVDQDGTTLLDTITFGTQTEDVSYGRYPNGDDTWGFHQVATPGEANRPHAE